MVKEKKKTWKVTEKATKLLKKGHICDNCLGRGFAELLSGFSNKERGKIIRNYVAMLIDSGEKIDLDTSNFYGIKFRNVKIRPKKPGKCRVCKNFFLKKIDEVAKRIAEKMGKYEFDTFLVGTILSPELIRLEEREWEKTGIDFVEPIKTEINREVGKRLEELTGKEADLDLPDMTVTINLKTNRIRLQIRSLYIYGKYKKLTRGIPQTKWICKDCGGKGCIKCKGEGKLYRTSVQEIIEKPLIKAAKAKKSKMHGAGREDIDARCLGRRPFVIELVRTMIRSVKLKKVQTKINKSKKVKVSGLRFSTKKEVQEIKKSRYDKTYLVEVTFSKNIDEEKLKLLKKLKGKTIKQKTPTRVSHRRANIVRKRKVKTISAKLLSKRKLELKIRGEAGLYIKEMISGDEDRTEPNVADILGNKVRKIRLDVIRIHSKI